MHELVEYIYIRMSCACVRACVCVCNDKDDREERNAWGKGIERFVPKTISRRTIRTPAKTCRLPHDLRLACVHERVRAGGEARERI